MFLTGFTSSHRSGSSQIHARTLQQGWSATRKLIQVVFQPPILHSAQVPRLRTESPGITADHLLIELDTQTSIAHDEATVGFGDVGEGAHDVLLLEDRLDRAAQLPLDHFFQRHAVKPVAEAVDMHLDPPRERAGQRLRATWGVVEFAIGQDVEPVNRLAVGRVEQAKGISQSRSQASVLAEPDGRLIHPRENPRGSSRASRNSRQHSCW